MAAKSLPWPSRFMAAQYKLYDRMRDRRAFEIAREQAQARDFGALRGHRQCLVVTYRRDGEPVPTPVNFGLDDGGRLYFRSEPHVAKIRRIRSEPRVRVCPCNMRGKPLGPIADGTARIVPAERERHAYETLAANWRADMRIVERAYDRIGVPAVYVEVAPASGVDASAP